MIYKYFNLFLSCNVLAILFNKLVSLSRWIVEHTSGSIKHCFG
ncbi:MAG: hypothetical protein ACMUEL_01035 [Flavobacteriales bacterium Tduv]